MGLRIARSDVEAVLVRRVIIGDGSCKCEGLIGMLGIDLVGVVMSTDNGLSLAVIWILLEDIVVFRADQKPS